MASDDSVMASPEEGPFTNPWPFLYVGLATTGAALLCSGTFLALPFLIVGLLATGAAIAVRPQSPAVLGLAALAGGFAVLGMNPEWDSARMMLGVLSAVSGVAALLMLLPTLVRRIAVTLLILFHFGGILTAVTSVAPYSPWVSQFLWVNVYRPYLELTYLTNAYHFYSPEPGPATHVWFYVKYEDGSGRWFKIPNRDNHPVAQEYVRRLSFTESVNQLDPPLSLFQLQEPYKARQEAGELHDIPMDPRIDISFQYRTPTFFARKLLQSYARYAARNTPHPTDPAIPVTGVKIYRVVHNILFPQELVEGFDPNYPTSFVPFYQGEFDPEGQLKNPQDPFLYWLIPILTEDQARQARSMTYLKQPQRVTFVPSSPWQGAKIEDFLEKHATEKDNSRQ